MKGVNIAAQPSGTGCVECLRDGSWWLHLRRCAQCGHLGCCDSSPNQHARKHFDETNHSIIQSFEPGEGWFWDYTAESEVDCPKLAPPHSHPKGQSVPGPKGKVPSNWMELLRD